EDGRLDAVTTVSPRAASATGSRIGVRAGERYRVADLLQATLVASANDACRALAEWQAGSEAAFVTRMNRRAADLKLVDTRFRNACGHDAEGHRSSARDLLDLGVAAMAQPAIATAVGQVDGRIVPVDGRRTLSFNNRNALIGRYDGAIGVKSGYTPNAGTCLIALAERAGVRVWVVLLRARDRWWDAHGLLDRGFEWAARQR
ncbi:MAG: D-alanyl-D-alanine carboxypeptidase, partial [Burkholderiales bacterium]|nr:D-alanyl-D-alanine carboxypeptidase [Burkholderiales bacterium]